MLFKVDLMGCDLGFTTRFSLSDCNWLNDLAKWFSVQLRIMNFMNFPNKKYAF